MFLTLSVLAGLIGFMFVASLASTISGLRRESEDFKTVLRQHKAF